MPSVRAVSFDAGFTLLEPTPGVDAVYLREARALGCDVDASTLRRRIREEWAAGSFRTGQHATSDDGERGTWREFTRRVADPFPELRSRHEEWLAALFAHFDDPRAWSVVDGAAEVLDGLAARNVRCAVASNWHSVLHGILAAHGLAARLELILTSAETGRRKPHPRMFETIVAHFGVLPAATVHVGDSLEEDVEAARAAGLRAVHFAPDAPEGEAGGFRRISRLARLLEILD